MNRLTNKEYCRCEDFIFPLGNAWVTTKKNDEAIYEKLKLLEDIEEELGIDLITLFTALKEGIFINDNGPVYRDYIRSIEYWSDCWGFISNDAYIDVLLKDYGKTWALTKTELEDEI